MSKAVSPVTRSILQPMGVYVAEGVAVGFLDLFRKPKTTVRPAGGGGDKIIPIGEALMSFGNEISAQLPHHLPTEQDTWWFLAEQYDYLVDCGESVEDLLAMSSLSMHEIEHEGRKSEHSYVGKPNPGVAFLKNARRVLAAKFDGDLADMVIAQAFIMFAEQNMPALNALRIKYANHFHKNCIRDGALRNAGRWQDVIDDIRSR